VGEAFYYPAANSLIGEFHHKTRAQAMAIHQTALYLGIVASGFIAGYIGENFGWRIAFLTFGLIGILWVVLLIFRLKGPLTIKQKKQNIPFKEVFQYLKGKPIFLMLSVAFGGFQFAMIGFLTWMPTFLHEKFNLSLSNAGFSSVFYVNAFAVAGVLFGGAFSDRFSQKWKKIRLKTEYISLLLGAPFLFWIGNAESLNALYIAFCGLGFFRGIYDSNLFAALFDFI
jgi:MFS family permease